MRFYHPDTGEEVPAEVALAAREAMSYEDANMVSGIGDVDVCTSFLFSNVNPNRDDVDQPPWLWETTVAGGVFSNRSLHAANRDQAVLHHVLVCELVEDEQAGMLEDPVRAWLSRFVQSQDQE